MYGNDPETKHKNLQRDNSGYRRVGSVFCFIALENCSVNCSVNCSSHASECPSSPQPDLRGPCQECYTGAAFTSHRLCVSLCGALFMLQEQFQMFVIRSPTAHFNFYEVKIKVKKITGRNEKLSEKQLGLHNLKSCATPLISKQVHMFKSLFITDQLQTESHC